MPHLRPYRPADRRAIYDICVRTADLGGDARGRYSTDDLMGDLFAGPYLHLDPHLAFVLDDGHGRAVGYVLGTADTEVFARRYRTEWMPLVGDRYPEPPPPPRTAEQDMVALHFRPERMVLPELAEWPAHLHIDLLPGHRGRGHGRRLIDAFRTAAAVPLHVAMVTANVRARGFYDRLGFEVLPVRDPGPLTYLGLRP